MKKINITARAAGFEDSHEARELRLYILNTAEVYKRFYTPTARSLARHYARGEYDQERARVAWLHVADAAARQYIADYDASGARVRDVFPVGVRAAVAAGLERSELEIVADYANGIANRGAK